MNINTSKSVKYLIGLCVAGLFACGLYVSLAYANVCFLPSGICDFGEAEVHEFVYTEPQGECTGDIEQDKSKCCLLSPLPYFKCEQCDNGRFKCEEQCINNDFQLITKHGTRRSECVCKGDACGSIPTANNNKDLRDMHCSVSLNSCGLCPEGKCVCNGEKCSNRNNGNKKYACTTGKTNNCGNCPTDRGASCKCVNCCEDLAPKGDYYSNSDRKCKDIAHTDDGSTCYRPYNCTCPEQFQDSQAGNICPDAANQVADFISNAENGDACYKCRNKSCADYSDNNVTYHESYSDLNETCQDYETVRLNNKTCYVYTNRSCEVVFSGYSDVSLFLSNANLRGGYSDCYSFTEKQDCKNYVGSCFLGRKRSCSDRGLLSSQPSGKVCDAISACDMTCFDPNTCRVPGPGCIENGGKFAANKSELPCEEICMETKTFPQDNGAVCYMCKPGCDPCKEINSAYRSSANDPCENSQCCKNGAWKPVPKSQAKKSPYYPSGRDGCYKCTSCSEIDANYQVGQVANCKTKNQLMENAQNCYRCPSCSEYGTSINANPAYQDSNTCSNGKIVVEAPGTNGCYQCKECNQLNSQWQSGSSCTGGKDAKEVLEYPQCKKCVKCPDDTWITSKPSTGEYSTWTDEDTGFTCYKCNNCACYGEEESSSACDSNKCYKANEQDHNGLKCYTCNKPRTCDEIHNSNPAYAHDSIYDKDQTGIGNLTCTKITDCGIDCWACKEKQDSKTCSEYWVEKETEGWRVYKDIQKGMNCVKMEPPANFDKTCYKCRNENGTCPATWWEEWKGKKLEWLDEKEKVEWQLVPSEFAYNDENEIATALKCNKSSPETFQVFQLKDTRYSYPNGNRCVYSYCIEKDCLSIGAFNRSDYVEKNDGFYYDDSIDDNEVRVCKFQQLDVPGANNCFRCGSCAEANEKGLCGEETCVEDNTECPSDREAIYVDRDALGGLACKACIRTCSKAGFLDIGGSCKNGVASVIFVGEIPCIACNKRDVGGEAASLCNGKSYITTTLNREEGYFAEAEQDLIKNGYERMPELYYEDDPDYDGGIVYYRCSKVNGNDGEIESYSNSIPSASCESCCAKEVGPYGDSSRIVMKSTAGSECVGVCNAANCCYAKVGKTVDNLCSIEEIGDSGSCNPADDGNYIPCPEGQTCMWNGGSSPSTEGHCASD